MAIYDKTRLLQFVDYGGLRWGNVRPMDVDGIVEYHNFCWILFEIKHRETPLPDAQALALSRTVDALSAAGKMVVLIVAEHNVDNPADDVDASCCHVRNYYYHGKWQQPCRYMTLKEAMDGFRRKAEQLEAKSPKMQP